MTELMKLINKKSGIKQVGSKEIMKDIYKNLGVNSVKSEGHNVLSTLESNTEKSHTYKLSNYDLGPLSSNLSKFDRNYQKVLDEFNSMGFDTQASTPHREDKDKNLQLKALQSHLNTKKEVKGRDFSARLKDMRLLILNKSNAINKVGNSSVLNFNSIKKAVPFDNCQNEGVNKLKENELINNTLKLRMVDFMKKTNEITKENKTKLNERITKENLMAEFKLFDKKEQNTISNFLSSPGNKQNSNKIHWNESFDYDDAYSCKREVAKKEIFSLLTPHHDSNKEHKKISRVKIIHNENNGYVNKRNNVAINHLDSERYPVDIILKMKKKFPDFIKCDSFSEKPKTYIENDRIKKMRNKIEKMF